MAFLWRIVQSDSTGSLNRDRCSSHRDSTYAAYAALRDVCTKLG